MTDAELEKIARELYFTTSERGLFPNRAIALILAALQKVSEAERRERGLKSIDRICDTCGGEKDSEGRCAMCLQATLTATEAQLAEARKDKERLDWLSENVRRNEGLAVGGYWYRSKLRWQKTRLRAAIDWAMNQ